MAGKTNAPRARRAAGTTGSSLPIKPSPLAASAPPAVSEMKRSLVIHADSGANFDDGENTAQASSMTAKTADLEEKLSAALLRIQEYENKANIDVMALEAARQDLEASRQDLEATRQDLSTARDTAFNLAMETSLLKEEASLMREQLAQIQQLAAKIDEANAEVADLELQLACHVPLPVEEKEYPTPKVVTTRPQPPPLILTRPPSMTALPPMPLTPLSPGMTPLSAAPFSSDNAPPVSAGTVAALMIQLREHQQLVAELQMLVRDLEKQVCLARRSGEDEAQLHLEYVKNVLVKYYSPGEEQFREVRDHFHLGAWTIEHSPQTNGIALL
ncbi:hypothetical protein BC828DRAFT_235834 [Blastocladiella britannica]|nr:hypothetical protein BC828DRAFT_235834 [Blastocladiella britannica]